MNAAPVECLPGVCYCRWNFWRCTVPCKEESSRYSSSHFWQMIGNALPIAFLPGHFSPQPMSCLKTKAKCEYIFVTPFTLISNTRITYKTIAQTLSCLHGNRNSGSHLTCNFHTFCSMSENGEHCSSCPNAKFFIFEWIDRRSMFFHVWQLTFQGWSYREVYRYSMWDPCSSLHGTPFLFSCLERGVMGMQKWNHTSNHMTHSPSWQVRIRHRLGVSIHEGTNHILDLLLALYACHTCMYAN